MSRKLYLVAFFLFLTLLQHFAFAQSASIIWKPTTRLTYQDFQISPVGNSIHLSLNYEYELIPQPFSKYIPIVKATATLDPNLSTLSEANEINLRYAQIYFNIYGYGTRLIQVKTVEMGTLQGNTESIRSVMNRHYGQISQRVKQLTHAFDKDLKMKPVPEVLDQWEHDVQRLIEETPEIEIKNQLSKWQLGMYAGVGRNVMQGKTKLYFTDATSFNFGFSFDVKKSRFSWDMNLGFNRTVDYFERRGVWEPGTKANLATFEFTYGRKLQRQDWLWVPYAGLGVNEFTPRGNDDNDRRNLTGYVPVVGLEITRYLKYTIHPGQRSGVFCKTRLSASPTTFFTNFTGTHLNLRLAIGFDAARVKKEMAYVKKNVVI